MNPFSIKTYAGPEYFLDRVKEADKILGAIKSERNLTLFSHRRFGKTMLIKHVFATLDNKAYQPLFVDLFATRNLVEFARKLAEVMYESKVFLESRLNRILGSLGVSMTFDPISGAPKINFGIVNKDLVIRSLPELFKSIRDTKKEVVIAFDEFQEVAGYEEATAEATIRTLMQDFPEITFIFSGSKKSLMKEIFTDANRPFFQSTQMMELHEIDRDVYAREVCNILKKHQKQFDPEVIYQVLDLTFCHTGFSQMVFSRLFSESDKSIDQQLFDLVWSEIIEDHKSMAREQEFLLPALQWKTMVAIAKEEYVSAPHSREFSIKHDLSSPSSVARAVQALLDKGLIIESGERGLRLYNVFIQKNLQRIYS